MTKFTRYVLLSILLCSISACTTTKDDNDLSSNSSDDDKNMMIKTAKINAQLGMAYLEQHNVERAKQKLLLALDEGPNIPEPWYSMAYFYEATGNEAMARDYYVKAITIAPNRGDAQNNYGTFLCRNKQYTESIQHFVLATQDPDYLNAGDAFENAGLCALNIPNKTLARQYFQRALELNPERAVSLQEMNQLDHPNAIRPKKRMKTMSDYLKNSA